MTAPVICHCKVCRAPVPDRAHQSMTRVRTCGPACASLLFKQEHPNWAHTPIEALE